MSQKALRLLPPLIPVFIFILVSSFFLLHSAYTAYDFPLDDAWIHQVYARSLWNNDGFSYNVGIPEAGSSSPLWSIVTAPIYGLEAAGIPVIVLGVKLMGIFLAVIFLRMLYEIFWTVTQMRFTSSLAVVLVALEPRLVFAALSGMETCLLLAIWSVMTVLVLRQKHVHTSVLAGFLPVVRPEAIVILPFVFLTTFYVIVKNNQSFKQVRVFWLSLIPSLMWGITNFRTTGHWFPNTFYIKSQTFQFGGQELLEIHGLLTSYGYGVSSIMLVGLTVGIVWLFWQRRSETLSLLILSFVSAMALLVGVVGTRTVIFDLSGYYWRRWGDPSYLILITLFALGVSLLITAILRTAGPKPHTKKAWAISLAGVLLIMSIIPSLADQTIKLREYLSYDARAIFMLNIQAGEWLRSNTSVNTTVAVNDAGAIKYFSQRTVIDLAGLNNADIAFDRKPVETIFSEIDWLVIFPSWFRPWIFDQFEQVVVFKIPMDEYTICNCPQNVKVIFKAKI